MVVRVHINEETKTFHGMFLLFNSLRKELGDPGGESPVWEYGKSKDWTGNTRCDSPLEIEFIDFFNEEDAVAFKLKWS